MNGHSFALRIRQCLRIALLTSWTAFGLWSIVDTPPAKLETHGTSSTQPF